MKKIVVFIVLMFFAQNAYAVREWAEIYGGTVWGIHEMPDNLVPVFNPNSFRIAVEITNLTPKPAARWKYNISTGEFSAPDIVYLNPITSKALVQRFTGAEREAFFSSVDSKVVMVKWWLSFSGDVNLNDPDVIAGINMLETKGVIGVGRAAIILTITEQ